MAYNIIDLTSQYGVLMTICTHLWAQDVVALAATCKTIHQHISGTSQRKDKLLKASRRCDGTSGMIWKDAILNVNALLMKEGNTHSLVRELSAEKLQLMMGLRQLAFDKVPCGSETDSMQVSKPCRECGEPVCNVSYSSIGQARGLC